MAASLAAFFGMQPPEAHAYSHGTHYLVTEIIAQACGVQHPKLVAWADAWVDLDPQTKPENPLNVEARKTFHFRTSPALPEFAMVGGKVVNITSDPEVVKRGSPEAARIVDYAIEHRDSDEVLLGIGLHTFQDSWAHEGYQPLWGHLMAGHLPDDARRDLPRAMEMAEATWEKIDRWSINHSSHPCEQNWSEIRESIETLLRDHSPAELRDMSQGYSSGTARDPRSIFNSWLDKIRRSF